MDLVEEGPILVVAGGGNNGGDGFVAAAELAARGREVSVILLCERDSLQGDAASAARGWKFPVLPFNPQAIGKPALIIDALFGAGLNRPVKGEPHEMIEAINANGAPVLSVDLPSGVNGTTGAVMGIAINATETVTFFRRKPAHLLLPGRMHCGRGARRRYRDRRARARGNSAADVREHSAALAPSRFRCRGSTAINMPAAMPSSCPATSRRPGRRGCRRGAALRAGAGLVTLASPRDALAVNAAALTAVMVRAIDTVVEFAELLDRQAPQRLCDRTGRRRRRADPRSRPHRAVGAAQPGAGRGRADELCRRPRIVCSRRSRASHDPQVVLTPHEGEFPRLFSDISNKHPIARNSNGCGPPPNAAAPSSCSRDRIRWWPRRTGAPPSPPTRRPGLPPPAPATCWRE